MGSQHLTIDAAMTHALELAARGPAYGLNPRVGCVLLAPPPGAGLAQVAAAPDAVDARARLVLAEGYHRGPARRTPRRQPWRTPAGAGSTSVARRRS
ncbi:hypothetical protein [Cellulosimicrobium sp. Marseille-Q8652]